MRYSSICTTGANKTKDFGAQSTQSALTIFNPIELSEQLKERNDALVQYIIVLKRKRNEIYDAYYNRENTRNSLNVDIETIGFKIELITKSLAQRVKARSLYDKTLKEIEARYAELVKYSGNLLNVVEREISDLEENLALKETQVVKVVESSKMSASVKERRDKLAALNFKCLGLPVCTQIIDLEKGICCIEEVPVKDRIASPKEESTPISSPDSSIQQYQSPPQQSTGSPSSPSLSKSSKGSKSPSEDVECDRLSGSCKETSSCKDEEIKPPSHRSLSDDLEEDEDEEDLTTKGSSESGSGTKNAFRVSKESLKDK
ncbi:uncharacterized protein LOC109597036 isoform X2 [Aethina tumida]|uniref:uncharacterized protein LOC109597036 isoform X2 n=1 Tax=Aethina tumida TaxID=116153 RepID=UPI0021471E46|nr:uncharacterized protein LOC109597036 isoform X2 [Aethina tumida]